jgi:hypothetical protein
LAITANAGKQNKNSINLISVLIVASTITILVISYSALYQHQVFALKPVAQITSAKSGNSDISNGGSIKILLSENSGKIVFDYRGFDDNDHVRELRCSWDGVNYLKSNCSFESTESRTTFTGPDGVARGYYVKTGAASRDLTESPNSYTFGVKVLNDNNELSPAVTWKFNIQKQITIDPGIHVIEPIDYKVKVKFDSITVHNNHEGLLHGDGEYYLYAIVQGRVLDLTEASLGHLYDVGSGQTVHFAPYAYVTVTIPQDLALSIYTVGFEEDKCGTALLGDRGSYTQAVTKILQGPKEDRYSEIRKLIDSTNKYFFVASGCGAIDDHDRIGFINRIYEPPGTITEVLGQSIESIGYGAGVHKNVLSTNGDYPDAPRSQAPADFTLRYTISVEPIPRN